MAATWTRLADGTWGVRPDGPVRVGDRIEVLRRDGRKAMVTIASVGSDNYGTVCRVAGRQTVASPRARRRRNAPAPVAAPMVFVAAPVRRQPAPPPPPMAPLPGQAERDEARKAKAQAEREKLARTYAENAERARQKREAETAHNRWLRERAVRQDAERMELVRLRGEAAAAGQKMARERKARAEAEAEWLRDDPSAARFRRLDLSDEPTSLAGRLEEAGVDASVERFKLLDLD